MNKAEYPVPVTALFAAPYAPPAWRFQVQAAADGSHQVIDALFCVPIERLGTHRTAAAAHQALATWQADLTVRFGWVFARSEVAA